MTEQDTGLVSSCNLFVLWKDHALSNLLAADTISSNFAGEGDSISTIIGWQFLK